MSVEGVLSSLGIGSPGSGYGFRRHAKRAQKKPPLFPAAANQVRGIDQAIRNYRRVVFRSLEYFGASFRLCSVRLTHKVVSSSSKLRSI
jgi:hypothetical protein